MSKNRLVYISLLAFCVIGFWMFENFYTPAIYTPDQPDNLEVFSERFLPTSTFGEIVRHQYYMFSYSEDHEQAEWLAYGLKQEHLTDHDRKRPYFIEDPKVRTKSADWRNYKRSGYDRGHLCPAGDRRFSEYAYNETFYTSNVSPQNRAFNAGLWNRLEIQIRRWCKRYGDMYIITAGVLEDGLVEIGEEDVDVPDYFYKIVLRFEDGQPKALAFLVPNAEVKKPLDQFLVPIDKLEAQTGIDFFHHQDESWQNEIELKVQQNGWKF